MKRLLEVLTVLTVTVLMLDCDDNKAHQPQWLTITHDGIWERDIDVSGWDEVDDAINLGEHPTDFYYTWQGEDSIDYHLEQGLLWVNGKVVGLLFDDYWGVTSVDSLPPEVELENIITIQDEVVDIRRLDNFPNLLCIYIRSSFRTDYSHLWNLPQSVKIYAACRSGRIAEIVDLPNLRGLVINPDSMFSGILDLTPLTKALNLRYLSMGGVINDMDFKRIGNLKNLRYLSMNQFTEQGITNEHIKLLRGLNELRVLKLQWVKIDTVGLRYLSQLKNLRELWMASGLYQGLSDEDYAIFNEFPRLQVLYLDYFSFGRSGLSYLGELDDLRELGLFGIAFPDSGVEQMLGLTSLRKLNLFESRVEDSHLAVLRGLPNLKDLNLRRSRVTDTGLVYFKEYLSLENLNIAATMVTDSGLTHLQEMNNLRYLNVGATWVTEEGARRLQEALPDCVIEY